jgi:hypothetical protein
MMDLLVLMNLLALQNTNVLDKIFTAVDSVVMEFLLTKNNVIPLSLIFVALLLAVLHLMQDFAELLLEDVILLSTVLELLEIALQMIVLLAQHVLEDVTNHMDNVFLLLGLLEMKFVNVPMDYTEETTVKFPLVNNSLLAVIAALTQNVDGVVLLDDVSNQMPT